MDWQPNQFTLANDLRCLTIPMNTESVTALLLVRVGSRDETQKLNGLSHFFEHMVFKGTEKWRTPMAVNRVIDSVGGVFNAFTSQEHTGFWVKIAKTHLPLALEFINQTVFHSLLPADELEKERGVILEEIKMFEDNPMRHVYDRFVSQVYSATPLGQPIIGPAGNIKAVQRVDFTQHLKAWYQPQNMVLALAGGVDASVRKLVEARFNDQGHPFKYSKRQEISLSQVKPNTQVVNKDIQQLHFCLGLTTLKRDHPDRYVMTLLNLIFGGNTSSRLWNEIREKRGLVYYIRSSTDSFFDTGYWVVQAGCDLKRGEEAVNVTLAELHKMVNGVTVEELNLAKEYIKGHLALSLEDSQDVADLFGEDLLIENKIRTLAKITQSIEAVTAGQVKALAQKLLDKNRLNLTLVGPVKYQVKYSRLLEK